MRRSLLVLAGVVVGVAATLFLTGPSLPPAAAQNPAPPPVGRYQISAFPAGGGQLSGAYVIDTATGEVFHVPGLEKPRSVGVVPKK